MNIEDGFPLPTNITSLLSYCDKNILDAIIHCTKHINLKI